MASPVAEEGTKPSAETPTTTTMIDEIYEFSATRFYDFVRGESDDDRRKAELWFDTALAHAPSPFMPRIKTNRSLTVETLCDFSLADHMTKETSDSSSESKASNLLETKPQNENIPAETKQQEANTVNPNQEESAIVVSADNGSNKADCNSLGEMGHMTKETSDSSSESKASNLLETKPQNENIPAETKQQEANTVNPNQEESAIVVSADNGSNKADCNSLRENESASVAKTISSDDAAHGSKSDKENRKSPVQVAKEASTPVQSVPETNSKKHQTAKKIASLVKNPSALKQPRSQSKSSQSKNAKTSKLAQSTQTCSQTTAATPNFALENQAIKRQKLEGGKSRQILSLKPQALPHKSKLGLTTSSSSFSISSSTANKTRKEDRKIYVRESVAPVPFISTAELMKKFQSSTRDLSLPYSTGSVKPRLTLTRPKEPEFETAQRVRSVKVKSTAELEEEMMAKVPKFKARPVNKKIFESPSLPPLPRSTPHPPEFKEFRLETTARATHNSDTASVASSEVSHQSKQWKAYHLTEPKTPLLHTSLRARPNLVKSSLELQQEELDKVPKFKARPLNKKIFESKGEIGIFCNVKKQVTIPQQFHFATNERIPPPHLSTVADIFDKMSLNSESRNEQPHPRITTPNPFHLHTEERGAEKERKFITEVVHKQWEEERGRVPKANPYPYTTDYPVIPPKPEPKQCTRPEPFQLESLVRHEEELQREIEETQRREKEDAQMRIFKAQPVLKEDPIPVPEKVRKPLTQVQEFTLQIDHRAVDRAEFNQKIKEKEMMYKRFREESDAARMVEEEKALKQLRRTMVPHARPVPNFSQPFCPQKSLKEITKAKSPNLRVLQRKEKQRRMVVNSAVSSAAANMR